MIAPLAITLALSFWAPYAGGQPVCPNGVQVVYEASALGDPTLWATGWVDPQDTGRPDLCRFHVRVNVTDEPVAYQCVIVAHELGHAAMGLPDSVDGTIMHGPLAIPGACYPPRVHKGQAWVRHHVRPDPAPRRHGPT